MIGKTVTVTVDRKLGTYHPRSNQILYSVNYGYVSGIIAGDGSEQDAYILGINEPLDTFTGKVIAIIHRNDDIEEKWVVAPENMLFTAEEIKKQTYFVEQYFNIEVKMSMWDTISIAWQIAFEQAWESFVNGSIPIGSSITDENGNVISFGRNRLYEDTTKNPKVAHAEAEAVRELDISKNPNVKSYTLYTTMEPCFMCMGTIVMGNLRKLRIAARDSYCGAAHYSINDPYIASKKIKVDFELGLLEAVQLVMQTYFEIKSQTGKMNQLTELFEKDNPLAVQIAQTLYVENRLDWHISNKIPFNKVFNEIATQIV